MRPHWFTAADGRQMFWYRVDQPDGTKQFVLVDAEKGERKPAFDHARAAAALAEAGVPKDDRLPAEKILFAPDLKSVFLLWPSQSWQLDLETYKATRAEGPDAPSSDLRPLEHFKLSGPSEEQTDVRFINESGQDVSLFWIDPGGNRRSYGTLAPGAQHTQHTYAGHVWEAIGKDGQRIAFFEAAETPGVARIAKAEQNHVERGDRPHSSASPDGKWQIVAKDHNLWLKGADGTEKQLTRDGSAESFYSAHEVYWSPESKHLVALRRNRGSQREITIRDPATGKPKSIRYLKPGDDVAYAKPHLFDVTKQKEIPVDDTLFANPWSIDGVRWQPDGKEFTFLYNQRGHQVLRVLGVEAASGKVRAIVEEKSPTFIDYSGKLFLEYAGDEIIWASERSGWNHLYLYDAKTGAVKNAITSGPWVVREVERVDPKKRQIWFQGSGRNQGEDPYQIHYYRVNFDGTGLTELTAGDGDHSVAFSPDNRFLIDTYSRPDTPPRSELRRAADGKLLCALETADASALERAAYPAPEPFVAMGRDGKTPIYGIIRRPRHFDPNKSYPVLEDIYAGPQDSFVPKSFSSGYRNQALLDRGFVIVQIDGMGTSNRSKAFHDVCYKNLADSGFPDRVLWIKAAAKKYPWMDLSRLGIFGGSAGGQSAMRALLDHGDFYKAAVADSGCHDNRMDKIWWNEQWMGWPVDGSYARSSNVDDAGKLQGKLLLVVGEGDTNVDPASTTAVADALKKAGKTFELLSVPEAGHGVLSTEKGQRALLDFFARAFLEKTPS